MMTNEQLAEEVARVKELDAKRTQGEWLPVQDERHRMQWNWFVGINSSANEVCSLFHDGDADGGCAKHNAAFIAHAPQMASLIAQLWEELGRARIDSDVWQSASNARDAIIQQQREVMRQAKTHACYIHLNAYDSPVKVSRCAEVLRDALDAALNHE